MKKIILALIIVITPLLAREYPVEEVTRIVDGDTVDVVIDLGFDITLKERLRFYGINAWETRGDERPLGLKAKQFVVEQLSGATVIYIDVPEKERGKYGRVLATLYVDGKNINKLLLEHGHARVEFYGQKPENADWATEFKPEKKTDK